MKSSTTQFALLFFALISTSVIANENNTIQHRQLAPEEMMFELNEEATCLAAAKFLENERYDIHLSSYQSLVTEFNVPDKAAESIINRTNSEYIYFSERAKKRYTEVDLHMLLTSAYTHRCLFMNGFETRRPFIEASHNN
ncbi:hypothetical protein RJ45_26090 [Photobacterium gaetbulicola]|uniref:Uncharacterized protein n=1 Tax=Photobacterium gaetbulicola TaxID=1295392 RepID=A0A0B9GG50_9GAMM|nr:hypothetical protein [Photobacterium gaetbulicola]KHT57971.1 hypothetical protein RJ45_26090 [Photobacterium gaetbulicola]